MGLYKRKMLLISGASACEAQWAGWGDISCGSNPPGSAVGHCLTWITLPKR